MKEYWILKKIKEDCLHDKVDVESIRKKAEKEIIQAEKEIIQVEKEIIQVKKSYKV